MRKKKTPGSQWFADLVGAKSAWSIASQLTLQTRRADGLMLAIMISTENGAVLAFQAAPPPTGGLAGAQSVLDDHAHQLLGQLLPLSKAMEFAEQCAAAWVVGAPFPACTCGEIAAAQ